MTKRKQYIGVGDTKRRAKKASPAVAGNAATATFKPWSVPASAEAHATRAGSKRARLIDLLFKGATLDELVDALGWNRATVSSSFRVDAAGLGYGVEKVEDAKRGDVYRLTLPKGLKRPVPHRS